MPVIDLSYVLVGNTIPIDHGYSLLSAICRVVPPTYRDRRVGVIPIWLGRIKRERGRDGPRG